MSAYGSSQLFFRLPDGYTVTLDAPLGATNQQVYQMLRERGYDGYAIIEAGTVHPDSAEIFRPASRGTVLNLILRKGPLPKSFAESHRDKLVTLQLQLQTVPPKNVYPSLPRGATVADLYQELATRGYPDVVVVETSSDRYLAPDSQDKVDFARDKYHLITGLTQLQNLQRQRYN